LITLTNHAKAQMRLRGIAFDDVKTVLSRPAGTLATRSNRLASYAEIQGRYIVVIHERKEEEDVIVTVMSVDRRRLARFGFSKI
jgi:hypothetical protein